MDNLSEFLEKINCSDSLRQQLAGGILLRPQFDKVSRILSVKIYIKRFLNSDAIKEFTEVLSNYFGLQTVVSFNVAEAKLEVNNVLNYIDYFNEVFKCKVVCIPIVSEDTVEIECEDEATFNKLAKFLKQMGINHSVIKKTAKFETLNDDKVIANSGNSYERTTSKRRRSKFTSEDDYPYLNMSKVAPINKNIQCIGKVFSIERRSGVSRKTGKPFDMETFVVTDFTDALTVKRFISANNPEEVSLEVKEGMVVRMFGVCNYDSYDNTNVIQLDKIEKLDYDPFVLVDDYDGEKHIDLHVHTNRSEYDGVCETSELINQAFKYGSKAIAITDNQVVQAYPLAQQSIFGIQGKNPGTDFKVIYGIDVKEVNDVLNIVTNPTDQRVKDSEFCVLDFETTGLSTKYDHIIEFGAVIVKNNVVTNEKMQLFVKPPTPIPPFIEYKTNITNKMLENAEPIETAIDKILDFIGDRVVVAHNADFDFNFLNDTLVRIGRKPIKNVCLDTLNLARMVLKDKKYYRLGIIAKNYKVEYDEDTAHRGDYDAMVLAEVLVRMLPTMENYETMTFADMQYKQPEDIYKKGHTYSKVILAKNMAGIKDIYEIVTLSHTKHLNYFAKENAKKIDSDVAAEPRILKSEVEERRARGNIIVGSSNQYSELFEIALNRSMADLESCMEQYDFIELNPLDNYRNLIEEGSSCDEDRIKQCINDIITTADRLGKPIVASADVYYTYPYQKIARDVYIMGKRIGGLRHPLFPMNREKRKKFVAADQHLMTTKQLLTAFEEIAPGREKEFVIDNPKMISDSIEKIFPIATELHTPTIEGCEDILKEVVYTNAHNKYGNPLPKIVEDRIVKELTNIINNGFSVQYYIAYLLVKRSDADGYPVGSRGSVGSSFIATMADITEVNPLVPHYLCPKCKHSEFFENNEYANGFDLPPKACPCCGEDMMRDGHNIPFETFLGFNGDKVPDIDLNFSAEYQGKAQKQIQEIFGEEYSYRAGTIGTVADKTAFGYVKGYCEEIERDFFSNAYTSVLASMCAGVKRTTGQHPGGIVVIPKENEVHDFSPIQYPANNPFSDWLTTHYAFADLHDNILKLDILAHVDPTAIRLLGQFSGYPYKEVPMSDPDVYSLFNSIEALKISDPDNIYKEQNGAAGLPEFGTHNNRRILKKTKPSSFYELVAFEGVTHGTDVWSNNAEVLIDEGICTLNEVISCRDDIMSYLIAKNMDKKMSFQIMEKVRKGKGLTAEWIEEMRKHDVPEWYINSCQLIKYMFPKAHAVAYAMNAVRVAWYKVHRPQAYYAVFFSVRCDAYDIETMIAGKTAIYNRLTDIQTRIEKGENVSNKEESLEPVLEIALEMTLRGYYFTNISLEKSDALYFTCDKDDPFAIVPSFNCIDGLGDAVANSIVEQRNIRPFISKEDFLKRTSVNNTQCAFMEKMGVLDGLTEENQLSLF